MTTAGLADAYKKYGDESGKVTALSGKWEGYHLVKYGTYCKKKVSNKELLDRCYESRGWSANKVEKYASRGGLKDAENFVNFFESIAEARNLCLFECFVDFLEFCAGETYLLGIFNDNQQELLEAISEKKIYIDEQRKKFGIPVNDNFNGLSIQWKSPNNSHENPVCEIEPCFAQKHLVIPNTYSNIDLDQPSTVLGWSSNLVPFIGRQKELGHLKAWLDSDAEKSIQVITGDGGIGKTRLAFHFAENIAYEEGWEAGQTGSDLSGRWFTGEEGILFIIDYPEERKTTVKQVLKSVYETDISQSKKRLRILLLSRDNDFPDLVEEEAPRLSNSPIYLKGLDTSELQWELANEAWKGLLHQQKIAASPLKPELQQDTITLPERFFHQWQEKAAIHKTPLMSLSLVYYVFIEPDTTQNGIMELTAQNIIRYMTKREIRFIRKEVTEYFGLKKLDKIHSHEEIFLLKAIASVRGGISQLNLQSIIEHANTMGINLPDAEHVCSMSIASEGALYSLFPDMLAADFLFFCLSKFSKENKSAWINIALGLYLLNEDKSPEIEREVIDNFSHYGRLLFDFLVRLDYMNMPEIHKDIITFTAQEIISSNSVHEWISDNLSRYPNNLIIKMILSGVMANSIGSLSVKYEKSPEEFGDTYIHRLNNISVLLDDLGNTQLSLEYIKRAVTVSENLMAKDYFTYAPSLALNLNNLSNSLYAVGDIDGSISASQYSIHIRKQLFDKEPSVYGIQLARSLNNLSLSLGEIGNKEESLSTMIESVHLWDKIAALPQNEIPESASADDYAAAHMNLAKAYIDVGEYENAVEEAYFAGSLFDKLAQQDLAMYGADLATCLNILSVAYLEVKKVGESIDAASKAIFIYRNLSALNNINYKEHLSACYMSLAKGFIANSQLNEAHQCAIEAINIRKSLFRNNPIRFGLDFIKSLDLAVELYVKDRNQEAAQNTHNSIISACEHVVFLSDNTSLKIKLAITLVNHCILFSINPNYVIRAAHIYQEEKGSSNQSSLVKIMNSLKHLLSMLKEHREDELIWLVDSVISKLEADN
ncbi:ATP-binding protein [Marinomonas mediterranea]|uniref:ATP-binding protein n=1 Tax=Marinomonas mediterranea TaxID=119864 RepID=UPI0023493E94|nr:ATP-binding protein [Marinomonas mediterranea]WCN09982.1 hypothetical protein GV055_14160 [Marinomonas mediterranea]